MTVPAKLLQGIRVLELARTLAGPWMGQLLADMGADVVKAERRGRGDETRGWGPPFVTDGAGQPLFSAYFQGCNRGKRSIEIDFNDEGDREVVRRLVASADIVIENFKVGTLDRFGLGARTLCEKYPGLIWCSITAFGQTGPYAKRPGYDFIIQAMSGLLALNGSGPSSTRRMPLPTSDLFTGVYGALTTLAALNRRNATGEGSFIDLSLFDTQVSTLGLHVLGHLHASAGEANNLHEAVVPQIVVPTADGHVALVITTNIHAERLFSAVGLVELADDDRFRDSAARRLNAHQLVSVLSDKTRGMPTASLIALLAGLEVPAGKVNTIEALIGDPQLRERGMMVSSGGGREVPSVRMPALFDGLAAVSDRAAPLLGEHNQDVIGDPAWGGQLDPGAVGSSQAEALHDHADALRSRNSSRGSRYEISE